MTALPSAPPLRGCCVLTKCICVCVCVYERVYVCVCMYVCEHVYRGHSHICIDCVPQRSKKMYKGM